MANDQAIFDISWHVNKDILGSEADAIAEISGWSITINLAIAQAVLARPSEPAKSGAVTIATTRSTKDTESVSVESRRGSSLFAMRCSAVIEFRRLNYCKCYSQIASTSPVPWRVMMSVLSCSSKNVPLAKL